MKKKFFIELSEIANTQEEKDFFERLLHQIKYGLTHKNGKVVIPGIGTLSLTQRKSPHDDSYFYKGVFKLEDSFKSKVEDSGDLLTRLSENKF